jgi:hypothetical protein
MPKKSWFCLLLMSLGVAGAIVGHAQGAATAIVLSAVMFCAGLAGI